MGWSATGAKTEICSSGQPLAPVADQKGKVNADKEKTTTFRIDNPDLIWCEEKFPTLWQPRLGTLCILCFPSEENFKCFLCSDSDPREGAKWPKPEGGWPPEQAPCESATKIEIHQKKSQMHFLQFRKELNTIDPQTNTTKSVVMTLLNYNQKDFILHWYKFFLFFTPFSPTQSIYQTFWAIFRGHHVPHGMHSSQMHLSIQHPNMYSSTIIQHNQSNTPVIIMHHDNVFT